LLLLRKLSPCFRWNVDDFIWPVDVVFKLIFGQFKNNNFFIDLLERGKEILFAYFENALITGEFPPDDLTENSPGLGHENV
jgi:hypothetical protein